MLASLIESNLRDRLAGSSILGGKRKRVLITAHDLDVHVLVTIGEGYAEIEGRFDPRPHLWIYTDSGTLMELPAMALMGGLPDLRHPTGRAATKLIVSGKLKVRGVLRVGLLSKIQRLLNIV